MNYIANTCFDVGEDGRAHVPADVADAVRMVTSRLLGCFLDDPKSREEILSLMGRC